ncbi:MAG TPA: YetF domain-containing protein, partial [Cellvibrio sp.]|nr:YetF domain-containing protein [Cellvibrio sp.]
ALLPVAVVFLTVLVLYRLTIFAIRRNKYLNAWIEGVPVTVVEDGLYDLESLKKLNISSSELLMEFRQRGVEHLGQVRLAIMETDGDVSIYFVAAEDVRPGLSVLPPGHRAEYKIAPHSGVHCCVNCGFSHRIESGNGAQCARCNHDVWSTALATHRADAN